MGKLFGKKVFVIAARGGDYSEPPASAFHFQEPLLRILLGFLGLYDVTFIRAEGMRQRVDQIADITRSAESVIAQLAAEAAEMVQTISRSVTGRGTALGETLSIAVRPHLDAIASLAAQTEAARSVPPENVEIIRNAGLLRVRSCRPSARRG